MGLKFTSNVTALGPTTATVSNTNAQIFDVSLRQVKSIQFIASGISTGNGAFGVEVSNDGTNWVVFNRLVPNVTNTNTQTTTRTTAPTMSANTSSIFFIEQDSYFRYIRIFVTVTTDGTYSAVMQTAG